VWLVSCWCRSGRTVHSINRQIQDCSYRARGFRPKEGKSSQGPGGIYKNESGSLRRSLAAPWPSYVRLRQTRSRARRSLSMAAGRHSRRTEGIFDFRLTPSRQIPICRDLDPTTNRHSDRLRSNRDRFVKGGFLYLIPAFWVWSRATGPAPTSSRDLATPLS
jgi:hypothetical protein